MNDDTDLSKDIYLNVPTLVEDIACVLSKEREIPKSESLTSPFELIKTFPRKQKNTILLYIYIERDSWYRV